MTAQRPADHESDASVNSDAPPVRAPSDTAATGTPENVPESVVVERPADEDHDLLTFGEAGARLEEEVIKQRRVIDLLRAGHADAATVAGAEHRLELLIRAQVRNRPPSLDDLRTSGFFRPRS